MKIFLLTAMLAPSLLSAETWDLAKDFSTDKNPNGPWFYGFSNYGGTTLTPLPAAKDILDVSGLNGWAAGRFPFVAKNTTDAALAGPGFDVAPGEIVLHPGEVPEDVVTVRWVAPSAGTYDVAAAFRRLDPGAKVAPFVIKQLGKPDQQILLGGKEIPAADSLKFSDGMLVLAAQDTLDFSVSAWEDGPGHDAIALSVRIAPTDPELLKPRLMLEYSFAADAKDSSGRNLHGTLHGNPRFEVLEGRAGLVFDGVGDWVEADPNLPALGNEFMIECWVRPAAKQAPYADIFGNQTSAGLGFVLQQNAAKTNEYAFTFSNGAGGWISTKPVRLTADRWQHVAITKSPKDLKFHLNGVLVDSITASVPVSASPLALRIGLGFEDEVRCFNGSISGFRIWDRALGEIKPEVTPEQKFDRIHNTAHVVNRAGCERITFDAPWRVSKADAINGLHRGVQHAHGEQVLAAGFDRIGHIKFKRRLCPLVLADFHLIDPDLGHVIDREETQDETPVFMRVRHNIKLAPIPCHSMIAWKDILDDPRHLGRLRIGLRGVEPLFLAPDILWISGDFPHISIERERRCRLRAQ